MHRNFTMSEDEPSSAGRQLLYFDQRSASQLLEVYVKRSLSDAGGLRKRKLKSRKCLTPTDGITQARRASSDTSAHRLSIEKILQTSESPKPPRSGSTFLPPRLSSQEKNRKAPETTGRKSFLRAFLHWFFKKGSDMRAEVLAPKPDSRPSELKADEAPKAVKKKHTFRKPSFRNIEKVEALKTPSPLTPEDVVRLPHGAYLPLNLFNVRSVMVIVLSCMFLQYNAQKWCLISHRLHQFLHRVLYTSAVNA